MRKKQEKMTFDDFEDIELEEIRKDEICGIVLQAGIKDLQNQVIDVSEVREACQLWNQAFEHLTIQHRDKTGALLDLESLNEPETFKDCFDSDFEILSSFVVNEASVLNGKNIPAKSWVLSLKVKNPQIFELIKEKKLNGFSIGALGIRSSNGVEQITNLLVPEISLVARPANQRNWLIIKGLDLEEIRNPYPNYHSCSVRDKKDFQQDSFRTIESEKSKVNLIIGRLYGDTKTTLQSIRYPVEEFTEEEARQSCQEKGGQFEKAKEK